MKNAAYALVAAAALAVTGGELLAQQQRLSPVTRVVELLQNLGKKVEEELKVEQELFQHFECWAKSVVSQKTAANAEAASRKQSLETYVADLDAGRIELTTERLDLNKEIAGLTADIEQATGLRTQANEDYVAAKAEMDQAITALEQAIAVLADGGQPGGPPNGALLRLRASAGSVQGGVAALEADARSVALLLDLAGRSLSKGDALFLRRVLTGEVPVKDWKKLNRKATFKNKYEARSGSIQKTLKSLLETFQDSSAEAEGKEGKAASLHTTLMGSKEDQKTKAQDALTAMEVEGAARGLSRSEAASEIEALGKQISDDTQYIADTQAALDIKSSEWAERKQIRTDEVQAISKAISILHSDDARDAMKKSLKSQGYSLVQGARHTQAARAVQVQSAAAGGRFDKVIESIDKMVVVLKAEEESDLKRKEACEKARAEDTRQAAVLSRAMDELTDTVTRLHSEIEELDGQIKEKKADIVAIQEQLSDAKRVREDETRDWTVSDAEDRDAALLVGEAISVLETFYSSLAFAQRQSRGTAGRQPVEGMAAGQAPPPPPSTWATPYAGKKDASTGVVGILSLIKEDIEKDRAKATQQEDASKQAYDRFKLESEGQIQALDSSVVELQGVVGDKEGEVENNKQDRSGKRTELEAVMEKIKDAAPGCNFFTVNHHARLESRQIELDGLHQAKQVLSGASFQ